MIIYKNSDLEIFLLFAVIVCYNFDIKQKVKEEIFLFELVVNGAFEAAHRLVDYPGKCNRLHGHSWTVEMSVSGDKLDKIGMVADFKVLKNLLMEVLDAMDHQYLNELPQFTKINPTAEHIAKYIYETVENYDVFKTTVKLDYIKVWESPKAAVIYRKDK